MSAQLTAESMKRATFSELCKIMEGRDEATRKFVQGILKAGILVGTGLISAEAAVVLYGAEKAAGSWLSGAKDAADSSGIAELASEKIVGFFNKEGWDKQENARVAHVLMVFSAYFDALEKSLPGFSKQIELDAANKLSFARSAVEAERDSELEEFDLGLPKGEDGLPKSYDSLEQFYTRMTHRLSKYVCGLSFYESLPGYEKTDVEKRLAVLPDEAVQTFKKQYEALAAKSKEFLSYALFGSLNTISGQVQTVDRKIDAMNDKLDEALRNQTEGQNGQKKYTLPPVPVKADAFVAGSRDAEVDRLSADFGKKNPICIWGVGGIGKTEAAKELAKRWAGNAYFTHFVLPADGNGEAMEETILRMDITGYEYTPNPGADARTQRQEEFQERLAVLRQHFGGALLIIDNCDRPGKTLDDLRGEKSFQALLNCGLQIVLTTRYPVEREPDWEIKPLEDRVLLVAMRNECHDTSVTEGQLRDLAEAVGFHTMTCVLMAKILRASRRKITPETMLERVRKSRISEIGGAKVSSGKDGDFEQKQIYEHLKTLFDLSGIQGEARTVLCCAALLPEQGMDCALFEDCLTESRQEGLTRLLEYGWLQNSEDNVLQIHPVVREVCLTELKPSRDTCGVFLDKLLAEYDAKNYDAPKFQQMADCFARASDRMEDPDGEYANHAGVLYQKVGQAQLVLSYLDRAVRLVEGQPSPDQERLAMVLNNLGSAYGDLGNYKTALEYLEKALAIREKVLPADHPDLAQSYNNIGSTYYDLGNHEKALEYLEKALAIWEEVLPEDHPDLALSYNNVGFTCGALGDHTKALAYQEKALAIREKVLPGNHPDLARSYNNVGSTYYAMGDYKKALEYLIKGAGILERALPEDHPDLILVYQNIAATCLELGDIGQAVRWWDKAEQVKALREKKS